MHSDKFFKKAKCIFTIDRKQYMILVNNTHCEKGEWL